MPAEFSCGNLKERTRYKGIGILEKIILKWI